MMKTMIKIAAVLCIAGGAFFLLSADVKELEPGAYIQWVENESNQLLKKKQVGNYTYELQYWPLEYRLLKESQTMRLGKKYIDLKKAQSDSMMFFRLRICENSRQKDVLESGINDNNSYYQRLDYMSYGFEENISAYNGGDTLLPCIYHFERTYSVSPYADALFCFKGKVKKEMTVLIDDVVFGGGPIRFEFSEPKLTKLPELKTY